MNPDLVLSIDCSTSSCKCIIWDCHGQIVAAERRSLPLVADRPLWHEQPAEAWWEAIVQNIRSLLHQMDASRLATMCITHQRETFVPVDECGVPLRNAILWMDERAGDLIPALERQMDNEVFHRLTGKPLSGNLSAAKIAWLREYDPLAFNRTFKFLDVQAYLIYQLTGQYSTSWGSADPMGLFDIEQHHWAETVIAGLHVNHDQLPDVYPPGQVVGFVQERAAQATGLNPGMSVVAGLGDGQSAGLGANITGDGAAYLSLGTSVITGYYAERPIISRQFRTMCGSIPDSYVLETVILGGTYTIDWLVRLLSGSNEGSQSSTTSLLNDLEAEAKQISPGAEGLMLIPYWNTAMNPYWDAKASGITVGWRGTHRRGHLYRAILEGIAFEIQLHAIGVEGELKSRVDRFVASGGGASSELWCQIIADVTGKTIYRAETSETASLGAAILAASAAGFYEDIRSAARAMSRINPDCFEPDTERHILYTQLFHEVYRQLYPTTRDALHRLALITRSYSKTSP